MSKNFQSELTQFINDFKQVNPETDAAQRAGRARLWDVELDSELQDGYRNSAVPQDPYVYYQKA